jgi:hypothetical protein
MFVPPLTKYTRMLKLEIPKEDIINFAILIFLAEVSNNFTNLYKFDLFLSKLFKQIFIINII